MNTLGSIKSCVNNGHDAEFCKSNCSVINVNSIVNGDSLDMMKCLPDESVDMIVTSPPYADRRAKTYGGVKPDVYVNWFLPFSSEMQRVLKPSGSFVLNINDLALNGERHPYVYQLVLALRDQGWKWIDTFMWYKKNPYPGKWRNRFKDGFEYIYHFTKTRDITWNPDSVRQPITEATKERISRLGKTDFSRVTSATGSGFGVTMANIEGLDTALPSNVLHMSTVSSNKKHSAPFPEKIPEFFIKAFSNEGDLVLDPFVGSGTTAVSAKRNCRNYIGMDKEPDFVKLSEENVGKVQDIECKI